jgi:2-polyprenyl-3-methyl-5-hydroxy-6-metoxy-1,4-benzoquinol methylase
VSVDLNTPEYWDEVYRREWETGAVQSGSYSRDYGPIHAAIVDLVAEGTRMLDVACGAGVLCRRVARERPATHVLGVDHSRYVIERNGQADVGLNIEYRCLDVRSELSALEPGGFDVVTVCEILEHLDRPGELIDASARLLRVGGRLIVTAPHDGEIPDPEHLHLLGHDEVFHLLARHGRAVTFMHFPPPYYSPWLLAHTVKQA